MIPKTGPMQWSITILALIVCTAFTNTVPHNIYMTLTTGVMQWKITILILAGCTAPPFTNKVPHSIQMTHKTSLMQWSIIVPVPTFCSTAIQLHQPLGHIQPAMAARVV